MSDKFNQLNAEQRAKLTQFLDVREESGRTALFLAAEANRVKCADVLLRYKASTEAENHSGITPLAVACDQGHTAMIILLIENGARCDVQINKKNLVQAVAGSIKDANEQCQVVEALLSNGCVVTDEQLDAIKAALPATQHTKWDESIKNAREARSKNLARAIGDAAPVPNDPTANTPMHEITAFLGFEQQLLKKQDE